MTYSDLHYERIDLDKSKTELANMISDFNGSDNAENQISIIKKIDSFSRDYMTYQAMASLNFSRDIHSQKAKEEKEYYDSISPEFIV